jgi:hypothetical protein
MEFKLLDYPDRQDVLTGALKSRKERQKRIRGMTMTTLCLGKQTKGLRKAGASESWERPVLSPGGFSPR